MSRLQNKLPFVAFLTVLLLGVISRLNLIAANNFWYDEAFSGVLIREDWGNMLRIIRQDAVHPPLYYFLLKIWGTIFGNTDVALRSFSLLFGIVLIIGSYFLLKRLINTKVALVAATIFALSPFFTLYSLEARSYSMLAVEVLIATVLFIKIARTPLANIKQLLRLKEFALLAVVCVLMIFTHYLSLGIVVAYAALLVAKLWPVLGKIMWALIIAVVVVVIGRGLLNGGDYNIYPKELTHTHWLNEATPANGGELLYAFIFGVDSQAIAKQEVFNIFQVSDANLIYLFAAVLIAVLVPALFFAFKGTKHARITSQLLLFCLAGVLIVSLLGINVLLPRYLTFLGVVFIIWIASLAEKANWKLIAVAVVIYLGMLTQVQWSNSSRQFDLLQIQQVVKNQRVVSVSPFNFLVLKYYTNNHPNLYFLDNAHFHMSENYWPYFDAEEVIEETLPGDFIVGD